MPTIYVYALSDFVTPIPNEAGARAVGNPPFTITTGPTLTRIAVEVTDNDTLFDEIDSNQVLTNDITIDGVTYNAGDRIFGNYALTNGSDPDLISITIGASNSGRNTTDLVASLVPFEPNTTYVYTGEPNFNGNSESYGNFVCFTRGTMIRAEHGLVAIETLRVGDKVVTRDNGLQTLRWIGHRELTQSELAENPKLKPIRIAAAALADGIPHRDLTVSPQHRIVVRSKIAIRMFDAEAVFVPARHLLELDGVDIVADADTVSYFHLMCDDHEIVEADGAYAETLYTGTETMRALSPAATTEIMSVFGNAPFVNRPLALQEPKGHQARKLIARHIQNDHPIYGEVH